MDVSLSKLQEIVKDRKAWCVAVHGSQKVGQDLATKQQKLQNIKCSKQIPKSSIKISKRGFLHWVKTGVDELRPLWILRFYFSSVQLLSHVWLFAALWIAARQASLSITISWSSFKLMSIESVMPSSHLILCCPLLLLLPIAPSITVFSNKSTCRVRWPKYWSFNFSIIPSNVHPGLISFRMNWLDLLAVQWTLKSLLQHHSSKASILRHSAFFTVQLSHPYMTIGKTIALTRWTFVGKAMSLFSFSIKLLMRIFKWFCVDTHLFHQSWLRYYLLDGSREWRSTQLYF